MAFVPNIDDDRKKMLETIGVDSFEELIKEIPENVRLKEKLNLPEKLSEYEVYRYLYELSSRNITASSHICFMGGGAYDRFIPAIVQSVIERPEFRTAYTPYQAEVSQGTLQAMYEFQSMICNLTGMDVSNASLYDGGSALAEACLMSYAHNRKSHFVIAGTINPFFKRVMETICAGKELTFEYIIASDGTCDLEKLENAVNEHTSAVIVQHPNPYGILEQVHKIGEIAHNKNAIYIAIVDMISLGILEAPSEYNADITVAEGQPLGIPMNFGGPYLGIFACKKDFVRKMPGRIAGITEDADGKRAFVLTLQTREQQIKREKATSNICTNQGLFMLAATVYMSIMGKNGIKEVAEQSLYKTHYLADKIVQIPGFKLAIDKPFFFDFLVETPVEPSIIINDAINYGILAGIDTSKFPECKKGLLISVTEKRTKEEMDNFVEYLKKFAI